MARLWRREYVYEMMRLGLEATPYRTLEHIAGVHHVAVTAGRALKKSGVAVDLALVSGAAAGHDIGKFGCRPGERVPYLHYYYTDLWFRRRRITDIGHVAANHSVWDLEPDYLSVESLLLIYADFRVKQTRGEHGEEITHISTLAEAFDVILSKLDGVDEAKRLRDQAQEESRRMLEKAQEDAKTIVSESETIQRAQRRSSEIIHQAEDRSRQLYQVANTYTEDALRRTEEAIQAALDEVRESRVRFRSASAEQMQVCQEKLKSDPTKQASED